MRRQARRGWPAQPPEPSDPLQLGKDGRLHLRVTDEGEWAHLVPPGGDVKLSRRGATALGRWLLDWSRPPKRWQLWGPGEIRKRYKVTERTLANWRSKPDFPEPVAQLDIGPVWHAPHVRAWVRDKRPRRGAPKGNRNAAGRRRRN